MTPADRAIVRLLRFHASPDGDLPGCICSLCGRDFSRLGNPDPRVTLEGEDLDSDMRDLPVRLFSESGWEMRFHVDCFEKVFVFEKELRQQALDGTAPGYFDVRPGLRVEFAWGDDETGKLVAMC